MARMLRVYTVFSILLLMASVLETAVATPRSVKHDDGIVGTTKKNGEGCVCHNLTSTPGVNVWITGPAVLPPGGSATYTLHLTGGAGVTGGFNVASARGSLASLTSETRMIGDELTHFVEKSFSGSQVHWSFTYQAPMSTGTDTIFSAGNSTNGDVIPNDADTWNFGEDFILSVAVQPPAAVPAVTEWGFAFLALALAVSGLLLLRRSRRV